MRGRAAEILAGRSLAHHRVNEAGHDDRLADAMRSREEISVRGPSAQFGEQTRCDFAMPEN
jgi:hypothetical protein